MTTVGEQLARNRCPVSGGFLRAGGAGEPGEAAEGHGAAGKVHLSRTRQKKWAKIGPLSAFSSCPRISQSGQGARAALWVTLWLDSVKFLKTSNFISDVSRLLVRTQSDFHLPNKLSLRSWTGRCRCPRAVHDAAQHRVHAGSAVQQRGAKRPRRHRDASPKGPETAAQRRAATSGQRGFSCGA